MVPLVVADLTRGTGRFNLGQGILGTATGIGASLSATLAGYVTDRFGSPSAFAALAAIALVGFAVVWLLMPETRPEKSRPSCEERSDDYPAPPIAARNGEQVLQAPARRRRPAADAARRCPTGCDRRPR